MKNLRKLSSFLLVLVMILGITTAVSADENGYSITLTGADSGHSYEAYQVFTGKMSDDKLVDVSWGDGVDGAALLQTLKDLEGTTFDECANAVDVAKILDEEEDDSVLLQTFADSVAKHLVAGKAAVSTDVTEENATSSTYKIQLPGAGYYFVKDGEDYLAVDGHGYSNYILKVANDTSVTVKSTCSELKKSIVDGENMVAASGKHAVGDMETYRIETAVPNTNYYPSYHFVVYDSLSKGLDFQADTVKITVDHATLVEDTDYTVRYSKNADTGVTAVTFDFGNIVENRRFSHAGDAVVITYQAQINQDANIGNEGNSNTAYLEFSNDPRDASAMGQTPRSVVDSYVTGIRLFKYTMDGTDQEPLAGAQFQISGTGLHQVKTSVEAFEPDADGIYWKLKDGTYTKTEWVEETKELYDSLTDKYTRTLTEQWITTDDQTLDYVGTTDENGFVSFQGLAAGTYEITEVRAPAGYTALKQSIQLTVDYYPETVYDTDETTVLYEQGWNYTVKYADGTAVDPSEIHVDAAGILTLNVLNNAGLHLPSTGSVGTTLFYVLGGILVAASAVLLIVRKRMQAKS